VRSEWGPIEDGRFIGFPSLGNGDSFTFTETQWNVTRAELDGRNVAVSESERGHQYTAMIWRDGKWEPIGCVGPLRQTEDELADWRRELPAAKYAIGFRDVPDWTVFV
jgi:hypothetical protein